MGTVGKCPHCGKNIDLGSGFGGPAYMDNEGEPFDPFEKEECPNCGNKVRKTEWQNPGFFMLWD